MMRAADIDSELCFAAQHRLGHPGGSMVENLDAIVRVARGVFLNHARQILNPDGRHAGNNDVAAMRPAGRVDLA